MSLFQWGKFNLHSGDESWWRIDCDDMTDSEIALFAKLIAEKVGSFSAVTSPASHAGSAVPRLVSALGAHMSHNAGGALLLVDDVLTTGSSLEEMKRGYEGLHDTLGDAVSRPSSIVGAVMFARGPCPDWVFPIWVLDNS